MKKQTLRLVLACAGALLFTGCATTPSTEPASKSAAIENNWYKIVVTKSPDDVKGMTRVGDVSASAHMLFGDPASLRKSATAKIKKQAAELGATIVLIQTDDFEATPINNVSMSGVAYK